ncbi:hypothetical protein OROHE_022637 [Orobanche hederae]
MGSNERITDYERRRLENIKRNDQMLAALKIHSRINDLSAAAAKRQRSSSSSKSRSPVKKPKSESHVVLRRSLGTHGVPPDAATARGLIDDIDDKKRIKQIHQLSSNSIGRKSPWEHGPITMRDAYNLEDGLHRELIKTLSCSRKAQLSDGGMAPCDY